MNYKAQVEALTVSRNSLQNELVEVSEMLRKVVKRATDPARVNGLQHDMALYDYYAPESENHNPIHVEPYLYIADLRLMINKAATRKARAAPKPSELDLLKENKHDRNNNEKAQLVTV